MLRTCRWSLCVVGGLAFGLVGCTSSRINTRTASLPPAGVEHTVSTEHLLRVADILEQQQQTQRAREIYEEILEREPGHPVASARLNPAPAGVAHTASGVTDSQPAVQETNAAPPNRLADLAETFAPDSSVGSTDAPSFPPAPPATVVEDVPVLKEVPVVTNVAPPMPTKAVDGPSIAKPAADQAETKESVKPLLKLKQIAVSSELRTTKVASSKTGEPQLQAVPDSTVRSIAQPTKVAAEPVLRIMPRSKGTQTVPLKLRSRTSSGFGVDGPPPSVTANELAGMIAGLMHQSSNTRAVAAFSLGRLGKNGKEALPHLERALRNEQSGPVQVRFAEAMARIDTDNSAALVMINDALQADDYKTRWEAVCASDVANRGSMNARRVAVKNLVDLLQDLNPKMRAMAALKLAEFGTAAAPALPALVEAARSGDNSLRKSAIAALAVLQPGMLPPTNGE